MSIKGVEGLSVMQVVDEVRRGGRFVVYQYCISIVIVTFRRSSAITFLPAGAGGGRQGLPYTLISLVAGWWGIPWGPIWTIQAIATNVRGGKDVTHEVLSQIERIGQAPPAAEALTDERPGERQVSADSTATDVLDLVDRLATLAPSSAVDVERTLDVRLTRDATRSTYGYDWLHADLYESPVAVTLRSPSDPAAASETILSLEVAAQPCVSQHDVAARFGPGIAGLDVPPPHAPPDAPLYMAYNRDWGRLAFGFDRRPPACLKTVILTLRADQPKARSRSADSS